MQTFYPFVIFVKEKGTFAKSVTTQQRWEVLVIHCPSDTASDPAAVAETVADSAHCSIAAFIPVSLRALTTMLISDVLFILIQHMDMHMCRHPPNAYIYMTKRCEYVCDWLILKTQDFHQTRPFHLLFR